MFFFCSECEESTEEYCGILLNCFTLKRPEYQNIIDDLAGNQLFHFVVETTDYALKILEKMSQLDLPGEANFLPLDQLQVSEKNLNIKDAVNTILMLNYDEQYDKAIRFVFFKIYTFFRIFKYIFVFIDFTRTV